MTYIALIITTLLPLSLYSSESFTETIKSKYNKDKKSYTISLPVKENKDSILNKKTKKSQGRRY